MYYTYEELAQACYAAQKANNTKTLFLAKMSHDMRTPLNGLLGFVGELKERDLTKECKKYVNYIDLCSRNLERLITGKISSGVSEC